MHKTNELTIYKLLTFAVLFAFVSQQVAIAAPGLSLQPYTTTMNVAKYGLAEIIQNPSKLQIPFENVTLKEIHKGTNGKLIIHIQDAHANYSGQMNLAKTLKHFMTKYDTSLVLAEGSSKDVTLDEIKGLADSKTWAIAAKRLLMEGIISGEEYLNLTSPSPMKIMGIEYQSLYDEGLITYKELASKRSKILSYLHKIRASLQRVKNQLYSKELLIFEEIKKSSDQTPGEFKTNISELLKLATQAELAVDKKYPEIYKLKLIQANEEAVAFDKANQQQSTVLRQLSNKGLKAEVKNFVEASKRTKNSQISQMTLLYGVFELAKQNNISFENFMELNKYYDYLKQFSQLDMPALLSELELLEDEVYKTLLVKEDGRRVRAIDRFLGLLEKAYKVQMSSDDFKMLLANEDDFKTLGWEAFINEKLRELEYFEDLVPYKPYFEEAAGLLHDFYDIVDQRDIAFLENANRIMQEQGQDIAFLIAGGYHTDHLTKLLREEGASFVVLTPVVRSETDHAKYEELLFMPLKNQSIESAIKPDVSRQQVIDTYRQGHIVNGNGHQRLLVGERNVFGLDLQNVSDEAARLALKSDTNDVMVENLTQDRPGVRMALSALQDNVSSWPGGWIDKSSVVEVKKELLSTDGNKAFEVVLANDHKSGHIIMTPFDDLYNFKISWNLTESGRYKVEISSHLMMIWDGVMQPDPQVHRAHELLIDEDELEILWMPYQGYKTFTLNFTPEVYQQIVSQGFFSSFSSLYNDNSQLDYGLFIEERSNPRSIQSSDLDADDVVALAEYAASSFGDAAEVLGFIQSHPAVADVVGFFDRIVETESDNVNLDRQEFDEKYLEIFLSVNEEYGDSAFVAATSLWAFAALRERIIPKLSNWLEDSEGIQRELMTIRRAYNKELRDIEDTLTRPDLAHALKTGILMNGLDFDGITSYYEFINRADTAIASILAKLSEDEETKTRMAVNNHANDEFESTARMASKSSAKQGSRLSALHNLETIEDADEKAEDTLRAINYGVLNNVQDQFGRTARQIVALYFVGDLVIDEVMRLIAEANATIDRIRVLSGIVAGKAAAYNKLNLHSESLIQGFARSVVDNPSRAGFDVRVADGMIHLTEMPDASGEEKTIEDWADSIAYTQKLGKSDERGWIAQILEQVEEETESATARLSVIPNDDSIGIALLSKDQGARVAANTVVGQPEVGKTLADVYYDLALDGKPLGVTPDAILAQVKQLARESRKQIDLNVIIPNYRAFLEATLQTGGLGEFNQKVLNAALDLLNAHELDENELERAQRGWASPSDHKQFVQQQEARANKILSNSGIMDRLAIPNPEYYVHVRSYHEEHALLAPFFRSFFVLSAIVYKKKERSEIEQGLELFKAIEASGQLKSLRLVESYVAGIGKVEDILPTTIIDAKTWDVDAVIQMIDVPTVGADKAFGVGPDAAEERTGLRILPQSVDVINTRIQAQMEAGRPASVDIPLAVLQGLSSEEIKALGGSSAEILLSTLGTILDETSDFTPEAREIMVANVLSVYADQNEETLLFKKLPTVTRDGPRGPQPIYNGIYILPLEKTYAELASYLAAEVAHFNQIIASGNAEQPYELQELAKLAEMVQRLQIAASGKSGEEQMLRVSDEDGQYIFNNWVTQKKLGDKLPVIGEIAYDTGVYIYAANGAPASLEWQASDGTTTFGAIRYAYEFSTRAVVSSGDWREMIESDAIPAGRTFPSASIQESPPIVTGEEARNTTLMMTRAEIDSHIDKLPSESRPGIGFILEDNGDFFIGLEAADQRFQIFNTVAFTTFEGSVFVKHLDSKNGYKAGFVRFDTRGVEELTENELPAAVRKELSTLRYDVIKRHVDYLGEADLSGVKILFSQEDGLVVLLHENDKEFRVDNLSGFTIFGGDLYIRRLNSFNRYLPEYVRFHTVGMFSNFLSDGGEDRLRREQLPEQVAKDFNLLGARLTLVETLELSGDFAYPTTLVEVTRGASVGLWSFRQSTFKGPTRFDSSEEMRLAWKSAASTTLRSTPQASQRPLAESRRPGFVASMRLSLTKIISRARANLQILRIAGKVEGTYQWFSLDGLGFGTDYFEGNIDKLNALKGAVGRYGGRFVVGTFETDLVKRQLLIDDAKQRGFEVVDITEVKNAAVIIAADQVDRLKELDLELQDNDGIDLIGYEAFRVESGQAYIPQLAQAVVRGVEFNGIGNKKRRGETFETRDLNITVLSSIQRDASLHIQAILEHVDNVTNVQTFEPLIIDALNNLKLPTFEVGLEFISQMVRSIIEVANDA